MTGAIAMAGGPARRAQAATIAPGRSVRQSWAQALNRVDRVVAVARLALATFSLVAVWLDPTQPAKYEALAYSLLLAYLGCALCLTVLAWQRAHPSTAMAVAVHAMDLLAFTALLYLTSGPSSPFFVLFTFALLSATLRWQWRGTLWTAVAALVVNLLLPAWEGSLPLEPGDELNRYVIRMTYLVVAALMLAYVGMHQTRLRGQLWRLADWPRHWKIDPDAPIGDLLEHSRAVVRCPRAIMVWTEPDEPWINLAWTGEAGVRYARESPGAFEPLVPAALETRTFVCLNCGGRGADVLFGHSRRPTRLPMAPLHPEFAARFAVTQVLSAPLAGATISGRLFLLDRLDFSPADFVIAEALATQCAVMLEQVELMEQLRRGAAVEERLRVARDLHDGLLQTLAAASIQIEASIGELERDPGRARAWLRDVQDTLRAEQRQVRGFVEESRPQHPRAVDPEVSLASVLDELVELEQRRWGLELATEVVPPAATVSAALARELRSVLREACANAARHGKARRVEIALRAGQLALHCRVADDGHGFPFAGRLEGEALAATHGAPRTILERVLALGGTLALESGPTGARLEIAVPLRGGAR